MSTVVGNIKNADSLSLEAYERCKFSMAQVLRTTDAIGFATDPRCSAPYKAMTAETGTYTPSVLNAEGKRYLERLPLSMERRLQLKQHSYPVQETLDGINRMEISGDVKEDLTCVLQSGGRLRRGGQ